MLKVGLTGGIGSGKSTVGNIFQFFGIPVYIADSRAHGLMVNDPAVKARIKELLGIESYNAGDLPDRKYIASKVFQNPDLLAGLNAIIHPAVREDFTSWCQTYHMKSYVLHEAAILFESGVAGEMDENIVVWAPEEVRIARVIARDHVAEEEVRSRMKYQWTDLEKISRAQFTVINDHGHSLIRQVKDLHETLCYIGANSSV